MRILDWPILPAVIALVAATSGVWACDTPVYRYAMYNWSPAPYQVFYLHAGRPVEQDRDVNRELSRKEQSAAVANIAFYSIDAAGKDEFGQLPEPIQAAWKHRPAGAAALHVLVSPRGAILFAGRLDKANVAALCDSPLRTRIGELLQQGHAAVLLVLDCPDKQRTRKAEHAVSEVIAEVDAGKVSAASPGDSSGSPAARANPGGGADGPPPRARLKIASLTVSRNDPAEKWLIRAMLSVESDLGKYPDQPMVFAAYGRGQILPPFVGKGITVDNLLDCVAFLGGACSCQVKDENPGVELPMRWDWQATADAVAADDKDFDGGQGVYREVSAGAAAGGMASAPAASVPSPAPGAAGLPKGASFARLDKPPLVPNPSTSRARRDPPGALVSMSYQINLIYEIGVTAAALVVLAAGVMMVRRKTNSRPLP